MTTLEKLKEIADNGTNLDEKMCAKKLLKFRENLMAQKLTDEFKIKSVYDGIFAHRNDIYKANTENLNTFLLLLHHSSKKAAENIQKI